MTQPDVAAALGIPVLQLWTVSGNPQFPRPISNDGAGNVVWNSTVIAAFVVLRNAAKATAGKSILRRCRRSISLSWPRTRPARATCRRAAIRRSTFDLHQYDPDRTALM
jgi:hypothetical protein